MGVREGLEQLPEWLTGNTITMWNLCGKDKAMLPITVNDRYSGYRFRGNDGFSGTKPPDDAILFTVSGITVLVELFFENFGF